MSVVELILIHGFFVFLLLYPLIGTLSYSQLKRFEEITEAMRISIYKQNILLQLSQVLLVYYIVSLFRTDYLAGTRLFSGNSLIALAMVLIFLSVIIWPIPKLQAYIKKSLEDLKLILPATRKERRYWAIVSIMAGLSEELSFRLFLIYYFTMIWGLSFTLAIILSTVIFGLAHAYQGWQGILSTAYFGGLLALLYLITGSILLPIIIHALVDLRILIIRKPQAA